MEISFACRDELLSWMNSQLSNYDECNDCAFTSIFELAEPDQDGCNWSVGNLRCSGAPAVVCTPVATMVARDARAKFNLG